MQFQQGSVAAAVNAHQNRLASRFSTFFLVLFLFRFVIFSLWIGWWRQTCFHALELTLPFLDFFHTHAPKANCWKWTATIDGWKCSCCYFPHTKCTFECVSVWSKFSAAYLLWTNIIFGFALSFVTFVDVRLMPKQIIGHRSGLVHTTPSANRGTSLALWASEIPADWPSIFNGIISPISKNQYSNLSPSLDGVSTERTKWQLIFICFMNTICWGVRRISLLTHSSERMSRIWQMKKKK